MGAAAEHRRAFYFIIHGVYAKTFIIDDEDSFEMYSDKQKGAVSLGVFRVYKAEYYKSSAYYVKLKRMHEKGHRKQSKWLGPLYLIVIGIPSINNMGYPPFVLQAHKQD